MKKLLIAALAVLCTALPLANAAPQAYDNMSGSKQTSIAYVEDSASASVTLVSAATSQYVTLYKIILSTSGADNFYLKCGSTQKTAKMYLPASGGIDTTLFPFYVRCASGEALSIVKGTAATPIGVTLWFTQQP